MFGNTVLGRAARLALRTISRRRRFSWRWRADVVAARRLPLEAQTGRATRQSGRVQRVGGASGQSGHGHRVPRLGSRCSAWCRSHGPDRSLLRTRSYTIGESPPLVPRAAAGCLQPGSRWSASATRFRANSRRRTGGLLSTAEHLAVTVISGRAVFGGSSPPSRCARANCRSYNHPFFVTRSPGAVIRAQRHRQAFGSQRPRSRDRQPLG